MSGAKKKFFQYTKEQMQNAVEEVKLGSSINAASKKYGVPRRTLSNKVNGKSPIDSKMGPKTVLDPTEEQSIVEWIVQISRLGFPLVPDDVLSTVQKIMMITKRENPFTDNRPSRRKWFKLFMKRHESALSLRTPEILSDSRGSVTEEQIRNWFLEIESFLKNEDMVEILSDPSRIFNIDESAFQTCPKTGKIIAPRGEKNVYELSKGSEKESITVAMCISADGKILPPLIVYPYKRIPSEVIKNVPEDWAVGKTDNGWMTGEAFFEYITNAFYLWLKEKNIKFPVILFLDGHKSHLTLQLSQFCEEKKIIPIALYPNTTHILQPCDVALFRPLKTAWKKTVHAWKLYHSQETLNKSNFPLLFQEALKQIDENTIINGFRKCGIYPWCADAVDYSKCLKKISTVVRCEDYSKKYKCLKNCKMVLESYMNEIITDFEENYKSTSTNWEGEDKYSELYKIWSCLKRDIEELENKIPKESATSSRKEKQENGNSENVTEEKRKLESSVGNQITNLIDETEKLPTSLDHDSVSFDTNIKNSESLERDNVTSSLKSPLEFPTTSSPKSPLEFPTTSFPKSPLEFPTTSSPSRKLGKRDLSSSDTSVDLPFKKALFWPESKTKISKRKNTEKMPSVVISKEWKKYYKNKEKAKLENEKQKKIRKQEREAKRKAKLEEISKKNKSKKKKIYIKKPEVPL